MPVYSNPVPVVVGLVFPTPRELVLITRAIEGEASFGHEALPGGYVETHHTWQEALRDEIDKEAHIEISDDPDDIELLMAESTPNKKQLLLFAVIAPENVRTVRPYSPTNETSARRLVGPDYWRAPKLFFPLHNKAVLRYVDEYVS